MIEQRPTDITDSVGCEIVKKKRVFTTDDLHNIRLVVVYDYAEQSQLAMAMILKLRMDITCKFVLNFAEANLEECK